MMTRDFGRVRWALVALALFACSSPTGTDGPPVATVQVSPSSANVTVGGSRTLEATLLDAKGDVLTGRQVFWTSNDTTVARVSGDGVVSGVAIGSAKIAASAEGQSALAAITVTPVPVAAVVVSPSSVDVPRFSTVQLAATARDANGNALEGRPITWASQSASIASVDQHGLVTGKKDGTATITATAEGKTGSAQVRVTRPAVAAVEVTPTNPQLEEGDTQPLTATVKDAAGHVLDEYTVSWGSSQTGVATVSGTGLVTAVRAGTTTITATAGGVIGSVTVTVARAPVATVVVAPADTTVFTGETVPLTATPRDAKGRSLSGRVVTWSTSDATIAIVSSNGVVLGMLPGDVTISATSEGKTGTARVHVKSIVARVVVSPGHVQLAKGSVRRLTATLYDASGGVITGPVITWSSADPKVAVVDQTGLVLGVKDGTTQVMATALGVQGAATVEVR